MSKYTCRFESWIVLRLQDCSVVAVGRGAVKGTPSVAESCYWRRRSPGELQGVGFECRVHSNLLGTEAVSVAVDWHRRKGALGLHRHSRCDIGDTSAIPLLGQQDPVGSGSGQLPLMVSRRQFRRLRSIRNDAEELPGGLDLHRGMSERGQADPAVMTDMQCIEILYTDGAFLRSDVTWTNGVDSNGTSPPAAHGGCP